MNTSSSGLSGLDRPGVHTQVAGVAVDVRDEVIEHALAADLAVPLVHVRRLGARGA